MSSYRDYENRRYQSTPYIRGNVVVKPDYDTREIERRRRSRQTSGKARAKESMITGKFMILLTAACIAVVAVCIIQLNLRARISVQSREITSLESSLASLKEENDTRYNRIYESINLEEVRNRAVNELGMTYASESQIVYYSQPQADYMTQNAAISQK